MQALRRQRQEYLCEFEDCLVYRPSSRQPGLHRETMSQKKLKATTTKTGVINKTTNISCKTLDKDKLTMSSFNLKWTSNLLAQLGKASSLWSQNYEESNTAKLTKTNKGLQAKGERAHNEGCRCHYSRQRSPTEFIHSYNYNSILWSDFSNFWPGHLSRFESLSSNMSFHQGYVI